MERIEYFKNYRKFASEIKELVSKYVNARVYVFGSIIKGKYSIGLSDIDIAIVSDEFKDRHKRLMIYDLLYNKYFDSPFEFHLLTSDKWEKMLKFIEKDYIEI